jgi:hypothetical protein
MRRGAGEKPSNENLSLFTFFSFAMLKENSFRHKHPQQISAAAAHKQAEKS